MKGFSSSTGGFDALSAAANDGFAAAGGRFGTAADSSAAATGSFGTPLEQPLVFLRPQLGCFHPAQVGLVLPWGYWAAVQVIHLYLLL